jgi:ribosomal 50S subunit-associated protein YjgA (DUF615 family)
MATKSKRDQMREGTARPRRRRTATDRKQLGQSLVPRSPKPLEKVMFVLEPEDLAWLNSTVAGLKSERRRTSKSEMVRLGIALMKKMDPDELRQHLRDLD